MYRVVSFQIQRPVRRARLERRRRAATRSSPASRERGADDAAACAKQIITRWRRRRIGGRRQPRRRQRAARSTTSDGVAAGRLRGRHPQRDHRRPREPVLPVSRRARPAGRRAGRRPTRSTTSSSRRSSRSSSGTRFPTTSCSRSRRAAICTSTTCSNAQVTRMLADPRPIRSRATSCSSGST